jgi:hypothetical protein
MKCSKCLFPNHKGSTFCSACGAKLDPLEAKPGEKVSVPANAEITINVVEKPKPKKLGCFGIFGAFILIALIFSAISGNTGNQNQSEEAPTADPNYFCSSMLRSLNEAVEYMGNAGSKYTVDEVAAVLKDQGDKLSSGYDFQMAGNAERLGWIRNAGKQLLQIRVAIIDGGDVEAPAASFSESLNLITDSCN